MLNMLLALYIDRWSLLGALGGVLLALGVLQWKKYPAAPGPQLASFGNIWQAYRMARGDFEKLNVELHRKHGK